MNTGKQLRLRRIWKHNRAVIIPFDHGQYGGVPAGLEDPRRLAERIAGTAADAVLVTPRILELIQESLGNLAVILRLDGGFTKYTPVVGDYESICGVEQAVANGSDAGIVFTFVGTDFDSASLSRLGRTAGESERWGLPLISEVLAPGLLNNHFERDVFHGQENKRTVDEETQVVARVAVEHGADIVKTRFSGNVDLFRKTVSSCGARVIVAGGPAIGKGDEALLRFGHDCVESGAAGIVFGRNVWQHPHMEKLVASLCAIVHHEEPVASALKLMR